MSAALIKRPQLTRDELLHLKWLLGGGLSLLGMGTVFYMDVEAWTLMTLAAVVTIATMVQPALPARVPRFVHVLAFPAIVAFFVGDLWFSGELLPAMVRLDVLLLLYRNISYRQRRDDLQVVVLGLFLVIVAGVLSVSLTFAVHLLIYTACALGLLLTITLTDSGEKAPASGGKPPAPKELMPAWVAHADARRMLRRLCEVADWRVIGLGAVLFAGVVAVSALLFLAIPRFQLENSMFLDRFIAKKSKSGFSDSISFGDVTEIQQDTSVAMSVDVSDQSAVPAAPYWRMLTLDSYEAGVFKLSQGFRAQEFERERSSVSLVGRAKPRRGPLPRWTFFLESGVSRYMPLLGQFGRMQFRETQNFLHAPRLAVVMLREEPASMTAYQVDGFEMSASLPDPVFAKRWSEREPDEAQGKTSLQAMLRMSGAEQIRLKRVTTEIIGDAAVSAPEFARLTGEWLRKQHSYSLSPNVPKGEGDPLVKWLTSREPGHCELFAGSFVVLARAAGYPARVVTGFRGGTWNGYSNNFTIRNADAHAWAEIFDEQTGAWLRTDPLAAGDVEQSTAAQSETAMAARLDRSWRARFDSLRVFWYRRIVSFDQQSQMETLKAMKTATQNTGKQLREWLTEVVGDIKQWATSPWDMRRVTTIAAIIVAALGAWRGWRDFGRGWWRRATRRRGQEHDDPVRREAGQWLGKLSPFRSAAVDGDAAETELQQVRVDL
ncbi:MAG: DUF3488 and transglutaminase-like domain-containing protein, partial [Verrucomicrobiota bacterium]